MLNIQNISTKSNAEVKYFSNPFKGFESLKGLMLGLIFLKKCNFFKIAPVIKLAGEKNFCR
jgi:hypothetical protein